MIVITDTAAEKAKEIINIEGKAGWGIRLFVSGSGCCGPAFGMDLAENPETGDSVVEKNGLKLFADKETANKLMGFTMDFIDDGENHGFVIKSDKPSSCSSGGGSCC